MDHASRWRVDSWFRGKQGYPPPGPGEQSRSIGDRLILVDALRGFALFGIIQINLPAFLVGSDPLNSLLGLHATTLDWVAFTLNTFFAEAKFYPLFAFLFGYGFGLQRQNLIRRGLEPGPVLLRRYGFLLALGILHGAFVFYGDILTMYALCGLMLLATASRDARRARRLILIWLILAVILVTLQLLGTSPDVTDGVPPALVDELRASLQRLAHGPFWASAFDRAALYGSAQLYQLGGFVPQLLFFMSLGAYSARIGLLSRPHRFRALWRRTLLLSLCLGIPINVLLTVVQLLQLQPEYVFPGMALVLDGLYPLAATLTPAYVALFVVAIHMARDRRWLQAGFAVLARLGRLALSNYLLQSLGMLLLFSNIGLGMADRLSLWQLSLIGLCTCTIQAVIAVLYLRRFRIGPAEWVWRRFVYATVDPAQKGSN